MDAKGTELVNTCKDELSQTSARIKLSDLNESWGDALTSLSAREEKLRQGLTLAKNYQVSLIFSVIKCIQVLSKNICGICFFSGYDETALLVLTEWLMLFSYTCFPHCTF